MNKDFLRKFLQSKIKLDQKFLNIIHDKHKVNVIPPLAYIEPFEYKNIIYNVAYFGSNKYRIYFNNLKFFDYLVFGDVILGRTHYTNFYHLLFNDLCYPARTLWFNNIYELGENFYHIYENTDVTSKINKIKEKFKTTKLRPDYYNLALMKSQFYALKIEKHLFVIDNTYIATIKLSI